MKIRFFIIIIFTIILAFFSLKFNWDLLYPLKLVKDLLYLPITAVNGREILLGEEVSLALAEEKDQEIKDLKSMLNLSTTLSEFDVIYATVISRNRDYWFNNITINKGSKSGIEPDMAVVTENGLIGKITDTTLTTSEIKLITTNDLNSKISVSISYDGGILYGIMNGYDEENNKLLITSTNKNIELNENLVTTSGMGGVFPSGIVIGHTSKIKSDQYDVGKIIEVTPSANFQSIRFIAVLKRK